MINIMFDKAKGWIAFKNLKLPEGMMPEIIGNTWQIVDNGLHKFADDMVNKNTEDGFYWLDGFIFNKQELMEKNNVAEWSDAFIKELNSEKPLKNLRGGFCGFADFKGKLSIYSDHIGNRSVYYYCANGIIVISSRFNYIVELLKYNGIELTFNIRAVNYMMSQGYMMDNDTFADEIRRVLPGEIIVIDNKNQITQNQYYIIDNIHINKSMTEDEAIELIDYYFRQAVKRSFDKDIEYGYKHLAELSGGLDSRMTSWVAHEMGYIDQTNITYSRSGYLDFTIAQDIAIYLRHKFYFMPLDDFEWYKDIDEILDKNNGAALYVGPTAGPRMISGINCERFGIVHSGDVGDAILGTFFADEQYSHSRPTSALKSYSKKVKCRLSNELLRKYKNIEQFVFFTRGLLGASSSNMIFQNYTETASPFLDVDFLDAVFTIPFGLRKGHYIYIKWMEKKYPQATEFGCERWGGIKPKSKNMKIAQKYVSCLKEYDKMKLKAGKIPKRSMNPFDYWFFDDKYTTNNWAAECFDKYKDALKDNARLSAQAKYLFKEGSAIEKAMVLTALKMTDYVQQIQYE